MSPMHPTRPSFPKLTAVDPKKSAIETISRNAAATFNYAIIETYEAGVVLQGTEIKSVREGKVDLSESYAFPQNNELWLLNTYIAPYSKGNIHNHEVRRRRKLLLHKLQLQKLLSQVAQRGYSIVPLRLYIKGRVAKVELGLGKGKRQYEKREATAERESNREIQRAMRRPE